MAFHFCPQCGSKLQPHFKFCPCCGEKLPCPDAPGPATSSSLCLSRGETLTSAVNTSHSVCEPIESAVRDSLTTTVVSTRSPLRKTRNSLKLEKLCIKDPTSPVSSISRVFDSRAEDKGLCQATPPRTHTVTLKADSRGEPSDSSPSAKCQKAVRGKAKRKAEEAVADTEVSSLPLSSPVLSSNSPSKGKSISKKCKSTPALEPLHEGSEVTDNAGKKWKLIHLLGQTTTELIYEVLPPSAKESNYIIKLGAKDGKVFNEQNFLQRAAKPASVEKWIKLNKMNFIGIPQCIGFGLHADSYRFLIFPNMGQSLQSLMNQQNKLLSEVTILQLACRILDVLHYIHSNEYVHADINAENIYIKPGQVSQVYLVGYNHAFRYCPGGQHVAYREGSRTLHEGAVEFISLDTHKGAAPSRRSDLQSLGYCMLYWHMGTLPWTMLTQPEQTAAEKEKYIKDVPSLLSHCYGKKTVSSAFESFLSVVMALEYTEQPDYAALKSSLNAALLQLGGSVEQPLRI